MGEVTEYPEGTFCWVDLPTPDLYAAKTFYGRIHGWEYEEMGPTYVLCRVDGHAVTGLFALPDVGDAARYWNNYVAVTDADATVARAAQLGAEVVEQPFDVGTDGRTAVVRDPSGALVAFWQAGTHKGAGLVNEPGSVTWNDLVTRDMDAANAFYTALFGWEPEDDEGGDYTSWSMGRLLIGGMQRIRPERPELRPHWMPYFVVENADEAVTAVTDGGGEVVVPPREVPAGRFSVIRDPAGTPSAIYELAPGGKHRGVDGS